MIKNLTVLFSLFCSLVFAQEINVTEISLNCGKGRECKELRKNFNSLRRSYVNLNHLGTILKLYVSNEGIRNFNYELYEKNEKYNLKINMIPKERVTNVVVKVKGIDKGYPSILPLKEGDFLDQQKIDRTIKLLSDLYKEKGFPRVNVQYKRKKQYDKSVEIIFTVKTGNPIKVKNIEILSKSIHQKKVLKRRLSSFLNQPFDIQALKNTIEEVRVVFLSYGYYLLQVNLKYKLRANNQVDLYIEVKNSDLHVFDVRLLDSSEKNISYKDVLAESVVNYKRVLGKNVIKQLMNDFLKRKGFLYPKVDVTERKYKNSMGEQVYLFKVDILKGSRTYVKEIEFRGNNVFSSAHLLRLYYENAFEQAARNIYDESYYKNFQDLIRQEYIKNGHVNVFIDQPEIKILPKTKNAAVVFRVREGGVTKVGELNISGVTDEIKSFLLKKIQTKSKQVFNPIAFKEDLEYISAYLKEQGYYFSKITNVREKSIVRYNDDNSKVSININVHLATRLYAQNIIVVGNRKTRTKFILREIFIKSGVKLTPKIVSDSQTNLLASGLFSSVNISPVETYNNKADILISLKEKDFGVVEIAPGVRTDLGPKISTAVTYNNLDGMNKRISLKAQVNQRFSLNTLDERRRIESNSLVEYLTILNYSENHIFDSAIDFSTQLSKSRRRFYSFDADIQKGSLTASWDINKWLGVSTTYQLETISQFDSTLDREHGHFQIGAITPGLTIDLRNDRINPTQGAHFNLTCEFANPSFLSQSNDELVINYYKLISRNRFYAKIPNGVLALSLSAGYQQNLATDRVSDNAGGITTSGYIPNIKVFRLSGMDIVRGFEDDEMNRLVTNQDVSEVRVDQRAYMANIKFEPRIFLSDSTMLGIFYDAGRVFVDSYDLSQLRSSAGISFKYLTPVGSLDFDYGIKLLRKRDDDGKLDSPGRLHVSIGFF